MSLVMWIFLVGFSGFMVGKKLESSRWKHNASKSGLGNCLGRYKVLPIRYYYNMAADHVRWEENNKSS